MSGVPFVKGHGTENDFILLPDTAGMLDLTDSRVRALCDRRAGLGADGVIRVTPATTPGTGFFMDYRNADGSVAEMCGNGARLFARYLVDLGWQRPGSFDFVTRGGVRSADLGVSGDVSIGMGPVTIGAQSKAETAGTGLVGTAVDVGNPHLVCLLDTDDDLDDLDLTTAPGFDRDVFPEGVNVEFVVPLAPDHASGCGCSNAVSGRPGRVEQGRWRRPPLSCPLEPATRWAWSASTSRADRSW